MASRKKVGHGCPVRHTLDIIGGKWKLPIISLLSQGTLRFTEIERKLPDISARMLIKELKDLESHQLLTRTIFAAVPLRVEYSLTDAGRSLGPMLLVMHDWGRNHMASLDQVSEPCSGERRLVPLMQPKE
ncbi:winged helix-turn-helix transcriptional regulator [Hymenobacter terrenus]|uniref:winged helix-turn-helix transcriptional regulator n=1 Tax=Hymenobacter terrenus TaxID=1629124 RepID=UPI000619A28A|nr:helix-turn-helix domain-containing protein [Hymenobacter terrenus]